MTSMKSGARRALVPAVAALAAAALLLSGCAPEGTAAPDSESAKQQRAFAAVYEQSLDWGFCGDDEAASEEMAAQLRDAGGRVEGMTCATIRAPFDWNDPSNDKTIGLRAVFFPSTGAGEKIGTLFSNPGGPGGSGINFAAGMTVGPTFEALQAQYDFIGFDPRGIGASSPLQCESSSSLLELDLARCAEEDPLALSMGTTQVARDMELMRHLLGEDVLNYAGFSYGTVIGASYLTLFPERVGRIMLDSAWPSDWSSPLGSYLQSEAIVQAMSQLLEGCGQQYEVSSCPVASGTQFDDTLLRLDAQPLVASDGTEIDGSMFEGYLTSGLYTLQEGRERALDTAGRAISGEQAAIDELAAQMATGGSKVGLSGMVVRCLSSPRNPGIMDVYRYIEAHGLPEHLGGPEINDETLKRWIDLGCDGLPDSGEDNLMFSNASERPVLVFGITGDHATPYAGAQQMVEELGNARLVTLEGSGHIASFQGRSKCADDIATAFMLRGELPAAGTVCADD